MNRTFPLTDINHPKWALVKPIAVEQVPLDGNRWKCSSAEVPEVFWGEGEAWSVALQQFQDNLAAAADGGMAELPAGVVRERVVAQVVTQAPAQSTSNLSGKTVYVLYEGERPPIDSIVTDLSWAKKYKKWNPKGSFLAVVVDEVAEEED